MENTMMENENKVQSPPVSNSPSKPRLDLLGLATLVGVIVMLTISAMNVWNVQRLGERVAKVEASLGGGRRSGPDPNRVHTIKTAGAPTKGPDTAAVTIVEFSEFQCPFCARVVPTLKQIEDTYQDKDESSGSTCRSPIIKTRLAPRSRRKPRGNRASSGIPRHAVRQSEPARARRLEAAREGFAARSETFRSGSAEHRREEEDRRRRRGGEQTRYHRNTRHLYQRPVHCGSPAIRDIRENHRRGAHQTEPADPVEAVVELKIAGPHEPKNGRATGRAAMCDRVVRMSVIGVCLAIASLATASVVAGQELRPNLRALPPSDLQILLNAATGNPELVLSATSWNSGPGPLELVAGTWRPGRPRCVSAHLHPGWRIHPEPGRDICFSCSTQSFSFRAIRRLYVEARQRPRCLPASKLQDQLLHHGHDES